MYRLIQTSNSWIPLILRFIVGIVFFTHGAQKLFGWFGGYGFDGTMEYFTGTVGLPWLIGFSVILLEVIGGLLLIFGLATRVWAVAITGLTIGIVAAVHWRHGFFMNWDGNQQGEGIEFFLLVLSASVSLFISGGGKYSIDSFIDTRLSRVTHQPLHFNNLFTESDLTHEKHQVLDSERIS